MKGGVVEYGRKRPGDKLGWYKKNDSDYGDDELKVVNMLKNFSPNTSLSYYWNHVFDPETSVKGTNAVDFATHLVNTIRLRVVADADMCKAGIVEHAPKTCYGHVGYTDVLYRAMTKFDKYFRDRARDFPSVHTNSLAQTINTTYRTLNGVTLTNHAAHKILANRLREEEDARAADRAEVNARLLLAADEKRAERLVAAEERKNIEASRAAAATLKAEEIEKYLFDQEEEEIEANRAADVAAVEDANSKAEEDAKPKKNKGAKAAAKTKKNKGDKKPTGAEDIEAIAAEEDERAAKAAEKPEFVRKSPRLAQQSQQTKSRGKQTKSRGIGGNQKTKRARRRTRRRTRRM